MRHTDFSISEVESLWTQWSELHFQIWIVTSSFMSMNFIYILIFLSNFKYFWAHTISLSSITTQRWSHRLQSISDFSLSSWTRILLHFSFNTGRTIGIVATNIKRTIDKDWPPEDGIQHLKAVGLKAWLIHDYRLDQSTNYYRDFETSRIMPLRNIKACGLMLIAKMALNKVSWCI